uniref:Family with sequence similarity 210 member B n=1 Tax=Hucho hucho TaxID=62062 RepID=A0A4W5JVX6_9TELE
MFLCRGARLSATALELGLNSTTRAAAQLKTNTPADITWTLRNNSQTVNSSRAFSGHVRGGDRDDSALSSNGKREKREKDMFSIKNWDSVRFIITHREQLPRVTLFAFNFSNKSILSPTYCNTRLLLHRTNGGQNRQKLHIDGLEAVLFTSGAVCKHRFFPTSTVQMRDLSSVAAAPKGLEDSTAVLKGDQTPKEASAKVPEEPKVPEPEEDKPSKAQQLKKVFKEYGAVGVSFHICISLMSLGMFYLAVSSGIDMAAILYKIGFSESLLQSKLAAGTSTFVLAYAVHKLFAPLRISITLVSVPLLVRYLRKTGLFKTPNSPTP